MKAIHYFFFLTIIFISTISRAQDTLRVNPHALDSLYSTTFILNDTGTANNPPFSIWLYNASVNTFNDSISFAYSVGTSVYSASQTDTSGFTFTPLSVSIPPHDSILVSSLQLHVSAPDFVVGSSTVVIWPVIYSGATLVLLDSASIQLTIEAPTGIGDIDPDDVKVYMAGQELFIKNYSKNLFGGIRIYNIEGQILSEQRICQSTEIPMSQYAEGIYMVELIFDNSQRAVYKVSNLAGH